MKKPPKPPKNRAADRLRGENPPKIGRLSKTSLRKSLATLVQFHMPPQISYSSSNFPYASEASTPFPNEVEYKIEEVFEIEVNCKIEVGHKIEEVVKIVVNCKIEEEVIWALGWDFRVDFGVHFWAEFYPLFWAPFLTLFRTFLSARFASFTGFFRSR
jgi:hypothetical protein